MIRRRLTGSPRFATPLVAIVVVALVVAGCAGAVASFDPTGSCVADGVAVGAYPELEALVPATFEDQAPETLDSGRNCTSENLGSLASAGIDEVRFAGGTWSFGGRRAAALVVFQAPGLRAADVAEFYRASAAIANRTEVTAATEMILADRKGFRLDTTTGDRVQTVLIWPASVADRVNVVLSTDLPDPKLLAAVDAIEAVADR